MISHYYEDLKPGNTFRSGPVVFTEAEIVEFSKRFDPLPVHTNPNSDEAQKFGGVIATGAHTLAVAFQLHVATGIFGESFIVGLGLENVRWPAPAQHGDSIRAEVIVLEMRRSNSQPGCGIMKSELRAYNQRNAGNDHGVDRDDQEPGQFAVTLH